MNIKMTATREIVGGNLVVTIPIPVLKCPICGKTGQRDHSRDTAKPLDMSQPLFMAIWGDPPGWYSINADGGCVSLCPDCAIPAVAARRLADEICSAAQANLTERIRLAGLK